MVTLSQVRTSNALVPTQLPPNPVAVFVGATSGIGLYTLQAFARNAKSPRVYFVGRSNEAGTRIKAECEKLCPSGTFVFIASDVSLLKNVDDVCRQIQAKETYINLMVVSQGSLVFGTDTSEGLHYAASLVHYSRVRFILNLLPLLRSAPTLRRVVSVLTGTKEGPIDTEDIQRRNMPLMAARGHGATLATLSYEALAAKAPEVGFVHVFPGHVKSGIARGTTGPVWAILKVVFEITGLFLRMPEGECGERHLFYATSERYRGRKEGKESGMQGVQVGDGVQVARGTDGVIGSGVYSVDQYGESAGESVEVLLKGLREQGTIEKIWKSTMEEFKRVTGSETI